MPTALRPLAAILLFGTLWGGSEVLLAEALQAAGLAHTSALLTVVALVLLAWADRALPRPGGLLGVAGVAALYRLTTAGVFWCHIVAILGLGALFEAARRILPLRASHPVRTGLTAAGLAYGAHALFGGLMTWVYRYGPWVRDGTGRLREHVLVWGTIAAVLAAVLVPLALRFAPRVVRATAQAPDAEGRPSRAALVLRASLGAGAVVALWVAGWVVTG